MTNMNDPVHEILATVIGPGTEGAWTDSTPIEELPHMDSLRHMQLIAAIEQRIGGKLEIEELLELAAVEDIRKLVESRSGHVAG